MVPQTAVRSSIGDKTTRFSRNNSIAYMHRSNKFCPVSSACPAVCCDLSSMKLLSFAVQLLSKFKLRSLNRNIWWCRFLNITILRAIPHGVRKWIFIAKGNSPPRAEGQRWEAQRVAEQCLETGGMMFERSEFLPPQALRQAASGEVWTDWKMSQSDSWTKEAPNAVHDCPCFWYFFQKSTERKTTVRI